MEDRSDAGDSARSSSFFYGWYIVGVGILVNIAGTFAFSSTLSIFLKPITEELGVSRGAFSLIRTFEIGIAALIVPLLGPWIDRYGGRGVLVLGALMEGTGLLLSGLVARETKAFFASPDWRSGQAAGDRPAVPTLRS